MQFPYDQYASINGPLTVYYPAGDEARARRISQLLERAGHQLSQLLQIPFPPLEIVLVNDKDWHRAPHDDEAELVTPHPYWTDATKTPSIIVPSELDPIFGEINEEKLAFILYHELALAFMEADPRPWPGDYPLWADEWQLKFGALWLAQTLNGVKGIVNTDLREEYEEVFEPEADGKTPDTIRGFDWYEDTSPEDYLAYELLLEQFGADLLARYEPELWPRFLTQFRVERETFLSDDITAMLVNALGPGSEQWLEDRVYF